MKAKISVCMSTYNGEQFLTEQLDSIVNQTKLPDEIIVFDDHSTDKTLSTISTYAEKHNNIKWIVRSNEKNIGWKINFYNVINAASGDYIFLADQDDIWMSDKIEKMSTVLDRNQNIDVLTTSLLLYYSEISKIKKVGKNDGSVVPLTDDSFLTYTARPGCSMAVRKSIVMEFDKLWKDNLPHDAMIWKIAFLKGTLYNYNYYGLKWRRHINAATTKKLKTISSENVSLHYDVILLYTNYYEAMKKVETITNQNKLRLEKFNQMIFLRKKLYLHKSFISYLNLLAYVSFYPSIKAYLLDSLALSPLNKVSNSAKGGVCDEG